MRFQFPILLAGLFLSVPPVRAQNSADCVRLLNARVNVAFGAQAGGPVSETDYITGIELIFDKLAEAGVDFSKLEAILKTDWLVDGGGVLPEKIRPAFTKQTKLISFTAEVFIRLERDLSARPELDAKIRAHVFESLQNRMTADARARAGVQEGVRETRVIDVRLDPTSLGFIFELVNHPTMRRSVKAPNGMIWSEALPGKYTNAGTAHAGEIITDSEAMKACEKIGGRLPTKEDYENLRTYFERSQSGHTTEQGQRDFHRIFPDMMKGHLFWTSSVPFRSGYAYVLYGADGYFGYERCIHLDYGSVRCVR